MIGGHERLMQIVVDLATPDSEIIEN